MRYHIEIYNVTEEGADRVLEALEDLCGFYGRFTVSKVLDSEVKDEDGPIFEDPIMSRLEEGDWLQ